MYRSGRKPGAYRVKAVKPNMLGKNRARKADLIIALWALALWARMALWALALWAQMVLWALAFWARMALWARIGF